MLMLLSCGNTQQSVQGRAPKAGKPRWLEAPKPALQQAVAAAQQPQQANVNVSVMQRSFVLNPDFHWLPAAPGHYEPLLYELEANDIEDAGIALSALLGVVPAHAMRLGRACIADEHDFRQLGEEMAAIASAPPPLSTGLPGLQAALGWGRPEQAPRGVPRRHTRRPISSFSSIIIWAWEVPLPDNASFYHAHGAYRAYWHA